VNKKVLVFPSSHVFVSGRNLRKQCLAEDTGIEPAHFTHSNLSPLLPNPP